MTARDDDHIRVLVRHDSVEGLLKAVGIDRCGFRKPLAVGINRPIIDDGGLESGNGRNFGDLRGDVARAEDDDFRRRKDRFDKNFQLAAADQAAFGHRVVRKIEAHNASLLFPDHILSRGPDFSFYTSAANGSQRRAIVANKHFRGLETGYGSPNLHDRGQGCLVSLLPEALNFVEDIDLHKAFSLTYLLTLIVPLS